MGGCHVSNGIIRSRTDIFFQAHSYCRSFMATRIEIHPLHPFPASLPPDARGAALLARFRQAMKLQSVRVVDVYTIDKHLNTDHIYASAQALTHPVTHHYIVRQEPMLHAYDEGFDWALEIGFLPGVTDNVASTAQETIEDRFGRKFAEGEKVYYSTLHLLKGKLTHADVEAIARDLANPLIQRIHIKDFVTYKQDKGMAFIVPKVRLTARPVADEVNLDVPDDTLREIGDRGIPNADGTFRGPLGLSLDELKAIRDYFKQQERRRPRDIELETLAQTWSEHCKHTIFASPIDEIEGGIYRHYIRRATETIRARRGNDDICVSVFKDNSGAIVFDDEYLITDKAETHNSPSALDPFGGAITGIVGVNRDTLGFGLGAKPIINRYGFCFADPFYTPHFYRGPNRSMPLLSPAAIMQGVVSGVNAGGNCSGIPTPQGFVYFDDRYAGKPLVFVGTVGLIPRQLAGKPSHVKSARPGDAIVMLGGRVGKDGIHGATFSSVALDEGSPSTAVQIGDPITQKKLSDTIIREARHMGLYSAITDNGAGGLSSSIGEMAQGSGGFHIELEKVPLKYPGMAPWEVWISESQERMSMAVPPENVETLISLMQRRGVEATVIGTFTDDGRARITMDGKLLMDMSMEFLHEGQPKIMQTTKVVEKQLSEPALSEPASLSGALEAMMGRLNICSREFIATQYDHEVQGTSVLKPLQGPGRVYAEATVSRPLLDRNRGVVTSQGVAPRYSDIDCYAMAAASIDMAVRSALAAGGHLDHLAIMDNFCWCDSTNPVRLAELKDAARACFDVAVAYGTPYISGKDSMFNDFKGYDEDGNPIMLSVPPTLLVSALGVVEDVHRAISLDAKMPGDLIYVIGETKNELGGSEYYAMQGALGANVPVLDTATNEATYRAYYETVKQELVQSAISVGFGGLGVALAKSLIGGQLAASIDLGKLERSSDVTRSDTALFSESLGRMVVTVAPADKDAFEALMDPFSISLIGVVEAGDTLVITGLDGKCSTVSVSQLEAAYKTPLSSF